MESYDTVRSLPSGVVAEFDDRKTLRVGVSTEYAFTPTFALFGGVDYIPTSFESGRRLNGVAGPIDDQSEDIMNAYVGASMKFNDFLKGTASYNFTKSSSDFNNNDYNRNRFSLGVTAEF